MSFKTPGEPVDFLGMHLATTDNHFIPPAVGRTDACRWNRPANREAEERLTAKPEPDRLHEKSEACLAGALPQLVKADLPGPPDDYECLGKQRQRQGNHE